MQKAMMMKSKTVCTKAPPCDSHLGSHYFLAIGHGLLNNPLMVREIHTAGEHTNGRHDYVVYQRCHNLAEGGTYDNTDSHIDNIAFMANSLNSLRNFFIIYDFLKEQPLKRCNIAARTAVVTDAGTKVAVHKIK